MGEGTAVSLFFTFCFFLTGCQETIALAVIMLLQRSSGPSSAPSRDRIGWDTEIVAKPRTSPLPFATNALKWKVDKEAAVERACGAYSPYG